MKNLLKKLYLMYWNEFITVNAFQDYINANQLYSNNFVDSKKVLRIIRIGRKLHNK